MHHGVDQLDEVRRQRGGRPGRRPRGGERELADHVVDVRLGSQQQIGRHLAEQHGVAALLLERVVRPGGQQRIDVDLGEIRHDWRLAGQLAPDDLAVGQRLHAGALGQALDQGEPSARHRFRALDQAQRQGSTVVHHFEPYAALAGSTRSVTGGPA